MKRRGQSSIGVATVLTWARGLAPGSSILELGCGHGVPISTALIDDGFVIYGIDASPTLTAAFRGRMPGAYITCEDVESSSFFGRTFDGILAVGLMFLLPADAQRDLIRRVAQALNSGGSFLFTSPAEECAWTDVLTGRRSLSLGAEEYERVLAGAGLALRDEYLDEGNNHYYDALK
jgi:SAM-dependent methyltransferase